MRGLDLTFRSPVTYLVGENGGSRNRAELQAHFASLLDERRNDPDFLGDPYARYGGRSLHARSHGEAFLAVMLNRMESGMFVMDEPEAAALSPQRQLALLVRMADLIARGTAVHRRHALARTLDVPGREHRELRPGTSALCRYRITRGILEAPELYWRRLLNDETSSDSSG